MPLAYVARRVGMFFLIVWLAATINFFLPRLGGQDPIREQLISQAALGGNVQSGLEEMIEIYNEKFGLNTPLWKQYLNYLGDMSRLDFNYSIANYPQRVMEIIGRAMPWTLVLLTTTTLFSWVVGTLLGAFMGWPRAPKFLSFLLPPLLSLSAVPFFLLGLVLIYVLAFRMRLFPLSGGYSPGTFPALTPTFLQDALRHSVLPALSIILVSLGGWALGMRAMMITTRGEDFVTYADAKGLKGRTIFLHYAIRNALLPQATALALVLGQLVSGAVLVEVVCSYPGIGNVLYEGIRAGDFYVVQGIIFILILSIGLATLILDLIYPLFDPRITYQRT
ncbi:MAG: ABC transporter permease [Chloroflexi bacterium]|nr:ABC transporter permease [Chloroflexota bacterium]